MSLATFGDRRRLRLEFGLVSAQGRRSSNQDFVAFCPGQKVVRAAASPWSRMNSGATRKAARRRRRPCARSSTAISTRRKISIPEQAAFRALEAVNAWVAAQARCDQKLQGMATTFTALLFIGGAAHVIHVGDSRAYRYAASRLEQLTIDHLADTGAMALALQRAIGFKSQVRIDHAALDLAYNDRFLLCSDGLHGVLSPTRVAEILRGAGTPQEASRQLKNAALEAGGTDNVSVLVVDILDTPPASREGLLDRLADAPFAPPPTRRDDRRLSARGGRGGDATPPDFPRDRRGFGTRRHAEISSFGLRRSRAEGDLRAGGLGRISGRPSGDRGSHRASAGRQSRLYAVAPFYDGETLEARIRRRPLPSLGEGLSMAGPLARALGHLHRRGIIHRAICADHVILLGGGGVRLIGLGHGQGAEGRECEGTGDYSCRPEAAIGPNWRQADDPTKRPIFTRWAPPAFACSRASIPTQLAPAVAVATGSAELAGRRAGERHGRGARSASRGRVRIRL